MKKKAMSLFDDYPKEDLIPVFRNKLREIKANINDLMATKQGFIAKSLCCPPSEDWQYDLAVSVIDGLLEAENGHYRRFRRYLDVVSDKPSPFSQTIDLEAIKRDIKCQDLMPTPPRQQTRGRLWYNAPWRNETKPSVVVYLDSNSFWDFGESSGGSNLDLYMKIYDCDFKTAIKNLAKFN